MEGGQVCQQLGQVKLARQVRGHTAPGVTQAGPDEGGLGLIVLSLDEPLDSGLGRIVESDKIGQILNTTSIPHIHIYRSLKLFFTPTFFTYKVF